MSARTFPGHDRMRLPVVAAPMFLVSGPDLVIAACKAGVIGSFPAPNCRTSDELRTWLEAISSAVRDDPDAAPWALNLVTHSTNARLAEDLTLVEQFQPPIVITALGSPKPVIETVHGYGGIVLADVVDLKLAQKAAAAGADGLVCVSAGAGGHTGHLSPFAFVAAVRDFFDGLVCVGGGITTGAGVLGAVAAGADLVYVGTRFLASTESQAVAPYKQMVVDHTVDDLIVSDAVTGTAASWLRPSLVAAGIDLTADGTKERNYDATGGANIKRWKDTWAAGQGLTTIRDVAPAAAIVDRLVEEFDQAREVLTVRLPQRAGTPS